MSFVHIVARANRWPASVRVRVAARGSRPTAKLVVAGTTELDASFILQKDNNLLGRTDPHSNIFPEIDLSRFDPETKVSRRHARIWLEGETFLVEDLGSVNGTVINDSVDSRRANRECWTVATNCALAKQRCTF